MSKELALFNTEPVKKEEGLKLLLKWGINKFNYKTPSISIEGEIPEAKKYDTEIKSKPTKDKSLF